MSVNYRSSLDSVEMKENIYIYGLYKKNSKRKNISDGLFYIGITDNPHRRTLNHKNNDYECCKSNNILKKRIINKYNFEIVIFWTVDSRKKALERETFLINWFGSMYEKTGILTNIKYTGSNFYLGVSKYSNSKKKEIVDKWIKSGDNALKYSKNIGIDSKTLINWGKKFYSKDELPVWTQSEDISRDFIDNLLDEYNKVCIEQTKTEFAKKHNIKRHRFTEWVNRYRKDIIDKQVEVENNRLLFIYNEYKKYNGKISNFIRTYKTSLVVINKAIKKYDKHS